jgi:CheY-like chemotaxis protein
VVERSVVVLLAYIVAPGAAWRWERRRRGRDEEELGPLELEALAGPADSIDGGEATVVDRIPRRVVVIDDDPVERELISEALEAEDVRVTATADAERALDLLDSEPARLAVLDWKMSGRSGAEILAELNIRHPEVRVIVIADGLEAQQRHVATLLGAEDFLVRPLARATVAAKINALIEPAQPRRAAE